MGAPEKKGGGLFRQKAMQRLASPEQIDKLLIVMTPKGWIALVTLFFLIIAALIWSFLGSIPITVEGKGILLTEEGVFNIVSGEDGIVTQMQLRPGDQVTKETLVAKVDNDEIRPLAEGNILEIYVQEGDWVHKGDPIAWAHYHAADNAPIVCYAYFPVAKGEKITEGMSAKVGLETLDIGLYGYLEGKVTNVPNFPTTERSMLNKLRNPGIIALLKGGHASVLQIDVALEKDPKTASGYKFTTKEGPPAEKVVAGTICDVRIITETKKPISYLFPAFNFSKKRHTTAKQPEMNEKS
jgi:pyruvate/2-oxoglutarate dehydrogenase complex dihydrolipoamide acyltransferase (E2) component